VSLVALIAGFAGVLFGAVLAPGVDASRLCFKAAPSSHWLGSSAVRQRTALQCSLAESGTSLRLVPCPLRFRSGFVTECVRCSVRSARSTLSRALLAWQTRAHGMQRVRAPSAA
jgi:hypothetical protein